MATREVFGFVYGYHDKARVRFIDVIFVGTETILFIDFQTKIAILFVKILCK